jgi:hypothetical protein
LTGVALGMIMPAMQVAVQHAAGRESLGAAIGSMSLCRSIGGSIGVAFAGAIIFVSMQRSGSGLGAVLEHAMGGGPEYLATLSAANRASIAADLDHTFRIVFFSIAIVTAAGVAIATTVPKPKL